MVELNATELQTPDWLNSGDNAWQLVSYDYRTVIFIKC